MLVLPTPFDPASKTSGLVNSSFLEEKLRKVERTSLEIESKGRGVFCNQKKVIGP